MRYNQAGSKHQAGSSVRRQDQACGGLKAILVRPRNVFCVDYMVLAEEINGFHDVRSDRACRGQQVLPKITRLIATTRKRGTKPHFRKKEQQRRLEEMDTPTETAS